VVETGVQPAGTFVVNATGLGQLDGLMIKSFMHGRQGGGQGGHGGTVITFEVAVHKLLHVTVTE
jgi:hypothetical protein